MLKKAALLSTCCGLHTHPYPHHGPSTSPSSLPQQRAGPSPDFRCKRSYANVHHMRGPDFRDNVNWPTKTSSANLTPYEIFDLDKGAAYSKRKFYELVKIYHPDRHYVEDSPCSRELSHGERLERYRLVILAHEILSDPNKKREYDKYGAGWADYQFTGSRHTRGCYAEGSRKPYGRGEGYDSSPFANATWEDWERWYARDANETAKQSYAGNYISPNMFASLILLMAITTGVAQAARAGQFSGSIEERAQAFTEETGRFLKGRADKQETAMLDAEGRIKSFLENRDPSKSGLKDHEEYIYKDRFLPHTPPASGIPEGSDVAD